MSRWNCSSNDNLVIVCHSLQAQQTLLITRDDAIHRWCTLTKYYTKVPSHWRVNTAKKQILLTGCWLMRSMDKCESNLTFSEHTRFWTCKMIGSFKWLDISDYDIPAFLVYITFFSQWECAIVYSTKKIFIKKRNLDYGTDMQTWEYRT